MPLKLYHNIVSGCVYELRGQLTLLEHSSILTSKYMVVLSWSRIRAAFL